MPFIPKLGRFTTTSVMRKVFAYFHSPTGRNTIFRSKGPYGIFFRTRHIRYSKTRKITNAIRKASKEKTRRSTYPRRHRIDRK